MRLKVYLSMVFMFCFSSGHAMQSCSQNEAVKRKADEETSQGGSLKHKKQKVDSSQELDDFDEKKAQQNSQEMIASLNQNTIINKCLRDNGIDQFISKVMLSDDEIETLIDEVPIIEAGYTIGGRWHRTAYYNEKNKIICSTSLREQTDFLVNSIGDQRSLTKWRDFTPNRLRYYLRSSRLCLSQVEFLKNIISAIKNNRELTVMVGRKSTIIWRPLLSQNDFEQAELTLHKSVKKDQQDEYKAYLLLPLPLREVARRYMRLQEMTLFERCREWIKKKLS